MASPDIVDWSTLLSSSLGSETAGKEGTHFTGSLMVQIGEGYLSAPRALAVLHVGHIRATLPADVLCVFSGTRPSWQG